MPGARALALALAFGVAVAGLVSCGGGSSDKLLPAANAAAIIAALDEVDRLASEGACDSAANAADQVAEQIDALPQSVDPRLRSNLTDGVDRLKQLAKDPDACEPATKTTPTVTETLTTPTVTQTQTTPTTPPPPDNGGGGVEPGGGAGAQGGGN